MDDLKAIIGDYDRFLTDILDQVEMQGFDENDLVQIDHLCYRTSSLENYEEKKDELTEYANFVGESTVNERPISTFRLKEPIFYDIWRIDAVELAAPKPESAQEDELEHIGYVVYDDLPTFLEKYSGKAFDLKSVDNPINPTVKLLLNGCSVKFHTVSLPVAVSIEQNFSSADVGW